MVGPQESAAGVGKAKPPHGTGLGQHEKSLKYGFYSRKVLLREGGSASAAPDTKSVLLGQSRSLSKRLGRFLLWYFFSTMHFEPPIKGCFYFPAVAEGHEGRVQQVEEGRPGQGVGFRLIPAGLRSRRQAATARQPPPPTATLDAALRGAGAA